MFSAGGAWAQYAGGALASAAQSPASAPARTIPSPFLGSVPIGQPTAEPLPLTILDTITRALEHNLGLSCRTTPAASRKARAGERWVRCCPTSTGASLEHDSSSTLRRTGFHCRKAF